MPANGNLLHSRRSIPHLRTLSLSTRDHALIWNASVPLYKAHIQVKWWLTRVADKVTGAGLTLLSFSCFQNFFLIYVRRYKKIVCGTIIISCFWFARFTIQCIFTRELVLEKTNSSRVLLEVERNGAPPPLQFHFLFNRIQRLQGRKCICLMISMKAALV